MKTLIISANTSWYLYNFRKNTIISLIDHGYKVFVVSPKDVYTDKLLDLGCEFININIDSNGKNPIKDIILLCKMYLIYGKVKPVVILNFTPKNNIYGTLAANFRQIATINNIAGLGSVFVRDDFVCKVTRFLYRLSQSKAKKIFFQNEDDRNLFLEKNIVSKTITDILPGSGVDLTRFQVSITPDNEKIKFLLIARMLYDKGVGYYAEAAKYLKGKYGNQVEFCLLGFIDPKKPGAVPREEIVSWSKSGFVTYLGTSDHVEHHIKSVDCVVLPSFYREGVPRSLLEAAAMGKPIVTTNNVGCKETVIDGVNGFLCEPKSIDSLVCSLEKMILLSHKERLMMGMKSRELAEEKFDENIVIRKYLDSIKDSV